MKKTILTITTAALLVIASVTFVGCENSEKGNNPAVHEHVEGEEHNHNNAEEKYQCPMKCEEDKVYEEAVQCPVCGMDLVEVE